MMKKKRPNFRLQRVHADGSSEEPMLYAIEEIDGEWEMGRRGFLATSFTLAGMVTGCSSVKTTVETGAVTRGGGGALPEAKTDKPDAQTSVPQSVSEKKAPVTVNGICNTDVSAHILNVQTLFFIGNGKYLVSGGKEDVLKIWEFPSGKLIRSNSKIPTKSMALGGVEGELIATTTAGGSGILLYDVRSGDILDSLKEVQYDYINCVAFDPTGTCMVSGRVDSKITLWDIARRSRIKQLKQHTEEVTALAFSPDGRFLASGARGEVLLWSVSTWQVVTKIKIGNISSVSGLTFSPDGQLLAVAAIYDNTVRLIRIPSGEAHCLLDGHDHNLHKAVAFSPDGATIATGATNNRIFLWKAETGNPFLILEGQRLHDSIKSLVFSQDGRYLVSGGESSIKIWMMPGGGAAYLSARSFHGSCGYQNKPVHHGGSVRTCHHFYTSLRSSDSEGGCMYLQLCPRIHGACSGQVFRVLEFDVPKSHLLFMQPGVHLCTGHVLTGIALSRATSPNPHSIPH